MTDENQMEATDVISCLEEIAMYFVKCYMNAPRNGKAKVRFHRYMIAADEAQKLLRNLEDDGK